MQLEEIIGFHTYRIETQNMEIYLVIHQFSQLFSKFLQRLPKCEKDDVIFSLETQASQGS